MMYSGVFQASLNQLAEAAAAEGILASTQALDNYRRVWARDSVVAGASILALEDPPAQLVGAFTNSLKTLADNQHPSGQIPSNVAFLHPDTRISYGGLSGRVDATAWFTLGCCWYARRYPEDTAFKAAFLPPVEKAFRVMEAWEFNGRDLMYVPLGGNWADEYLLEGYTLYDNLIRMRALEIAASVWSRTDWEEKGRAVRQRIEHNFWTGPGSPAPDYHITAFNRAPRRPYWAAAFSPAGYDMTFDLWSNALALLFGLGSLEQRRTATDYLKEMSSRFNGLIPAFYPVIHPGDPKWPHLENHFAYRFKNHPFHFHNGGIWPVVLGFAGAALAAMGENQAVRQMTDSLAAQCLKDELQFHEYLSSDQLVWGGTPHLTFSAAGFVLLYSALHSSSTFIFDSIAPSV